ncbi:MAG TPA: glycosyltransferase family 87 protein, partial [Candidatus Sulfotelmatobacter sp.]|nr:glycosyltransferase family 87 protein [Candidatus Sulfotelmatobacter sp.]
GVSRWARRGRFAVLAALADLTLFNAYQVLHSPTRWPDFAYFYAFAQAGLQHGYAHLYETATQDAAVHALFPGAPLLIVVNPPPFAWLLAPLTVIGYRPALWIWTASMIVALAAASQLVSPPDRYSRALFIGSWLGFLPAYLLFVSAPLAPLIVLSLVVAWWLVRSDHEVAAGLVLAIGLLKPTLAILVPFTLLAAGHRKLFLAWLAASIVFVIASAASLGESGIRAYLTMSTAFASNAYYLRWSLVPILGDGAPWLAAVLLLTAATMLVAWVLRHDGPEPVIAVGVMGSVLVNHHMTPGDLMMLLAPIWLLARAQGSWVRNVLLGVAWSGGWLALIFPALVLVVAAGTPLALAIQHAVVRSRPQPALRGAEGEI